MNPFKASRLRKQSRVANLEQRIVDLEIELIAERKVNDGLQRGIVLACDPSATAAERVEEAMDRFGEDAYGQIVQAPDGEFIAPAAYDFERLAHEMYDQDKGGASGSW